MPPQLTHKQQRLVHALPEHPNVSQAAKAIGVTRQSAHRMLTNGDVRSAALRKMAEQSGNAQGVVKKLERVHERMVQKLDSIAFDNLDPAHQLGALKIVGDSVVLAFRSNLSGVRIKNWPGLPAESLGFNTDGIQEGPDGFPLTGWSPGEDGGHHNIIDDRDDNTTSDNGTGGATRARSNGGTGR